jgi:hypothetical protein
MISDACCGVMRPPYLPAQRSAAFRRSLFITRTRCEPPNRHLFPKRGRTLRLKKRDSSSLRWPNPSFGRNIAIGRGMTRKGTIRTTDPFL